MAHIALFACLCMSSACQDGVHDSRDVAGGGAVMRLADPVPEGSIPRGSVRREGATAGDAANGTGEPAITARVLERGHEIYELHCLPCHGSTGRGNGIVTARGFPQPPSFHEGELRDISLQRIVEVVTEGQGAMASFAERIAPEDRHAVAAYIKSMQLAVSGSPEARVRDAARQTPAEGGVQERDR